MGYIKDDWPITFSAKDENLRDDEAHHAYLADQERYQMINVTGLATKHPKKKGGSPVCLEDEELQCHKALILYRKKPTRTPFIYPADFCS